MIFATNNFKTAEALSKICIDRSANKELFSWQEMMNFSMDSQIVLMQKDGPIICKKTYYNNDEAEKAKIEEA